MRFVLTYLRQASVALRLLIVLSVVLGVLYPLVVTGIAQIPGLKNPADGSPLHSGGQTVGSAIIGQSFTDSDGAPILKYFQSRPSSGDYDPTASGASNLGPESVVDTLPDPSVPDDTGTPSLLTLVCSRSAAIGQAYGVDGSRPFCADGVGAVLAVFWSGPGYAGHVVRAVSLNQACPTVPFLATYHGVKVECARFGDDYSAGQVVPIRGDAPAHPAVPADAVTASGSGLDPGISVAYARLQQRVVARQRHVAVAQVAALVNKYTDTRALGFLGQPTVNVLELNLALDRTYPVG